ncbi:MAG: CehA/McbA family metallohydrolase [Candidatus Acidiferrales bacterium]
MKSKIFTIAILAAATAGPIAAQRKPVLPQIDLPHPYYFREMYLPQLTSGPSSVAWSPDSKEVVYSMAGSLWRQNLGASVAQQVTDGPGYDYQPDWSPDGQKVVYCSYQKDAVEMWLLDLETGKTVQLTSGGAVNVEPRWSPDGKQIVFVSTSYNKRFHIFRADVQNGKLENVTRLTGETKSPLPRYYYSAFDHEISPVWSRDGKEILFVSNRGHIYGTGGFWRVRAEPGAEAREIHYEETTWRARPDFSPDGTRIVFSSYLGRQWHQLWIMPANGGDAFPVSYGNWDETSVRWSPDGKQLAFVSNRNGETELWTENVPGGEQLRLDAAERRYLRPKARLRLRVLDPEGGVTPARISVMDAGGRFYAPEHAWIHGDDGFDRTERAFEAHYFHAAGTAEVEVPAEKITVEVMKGFEYSLERRTIDLSAGQPASVTVQLKPLMIAGKSDAHWVSSDLHVHMNYAGTYRNTPAHLVEQAEAENLGIVNDLIVNKEQRFPDIAYEGKQLDPASKPDALLVHGQEFHTSYWGHRGLLNLQSNLLLPGYAGYPSTAAASLFPMNADVYDMAHAHGALVGVVHPFEEIPDPFANPPQKITDELPVDVALGKLDYMEIVGFSDHRSTAAVWYRLLNLGFRIPAGAGTDAMANYASLRGPVGMNRVYASVKSGPLDIVALLEALKKGRTFATNGPLPDFSLGGESIGGELKFDGPQTAIPFKTRLRSIVPVDRFEMVCNGRVVQTLPLNSARDAADVSGAVAVKESGWCVLRASSDKAEYPVLDNYVYATTSPIYVTIGGKPPRSPEDAKYFVAWIERVADATSHYPDWNSASEKEGVLKELARAKTVFEKLR